MTLTGVELSAEQEAFVASQVESGDYADAGDVVREALLAFEKRQQGNAKKLEALQQLIQEGFDSGVAEGDVFARVRARAGLPPRDRD